jgi:hypothetical protein
VQFARPITDGTGMSIREKEVAYIYRLLKMTSLKERQCDMTAAGRNSGTRKKLHCWHWLDRHLFVSTNA